MLKKLFLYFLESLKKEFYYSGLDNDNKIGGGGREVGRCISKNFISEKFHFEKFT